MTLQTLSAPLSKIFRLRASQTLHVYHDTGFLYSLIILLLAATAFAWGYTIVTGDGYQQYAPVAMFAIIIYPIQANRRDRKFLSSNFGRYRAIFLAEYASISLPFLLLYFSVGKLIPVAAISASAVAVAFVPQVEIKRDLLGPLWSRLPAQAYEIKSFMRRGGIFYLVLLLFMLVLPQYPATIPIGLAVGGMIAISCYEWGEPVAVLRSAELGTRAFLHQRFTLVMKLFGLWATAPAVLFVAFNLDYWYVLPAELAILAAVIWYGILVKYTFYHPNEKTNSRLFAVVGPLSIIIPVLLPLVLLLSVYFYRRALANLNPYLYDFDTVA